MTETSKRVSVTLTIATDAAPGAVVTELPSLLPDELCERIVGITGHAFDMDDLDSEEEPIAFAVFGRDLKFVELLPGEEARACAVQLAEELGGLAIAMPIVGGRSALWAVPGDGTCTASEQGMGSPSHGRVTDPGGLTTSIDDGE